MVVMSGDNPIYALSSDVVIPISVPYSKESMTRDYINIYPAPKRNSGCADEKAPSCGAQLTSSVAVKPFAANHVHLQDAGDTHCSTKQSQTAVSAAGHCSDVKEPCNDVDSVSGTESSLAARNNCYENVYSN